MINLLLYSFFYANFYGAKFMDIIMIDRAGILDFYRHLGLGTYLP